MANQNMIKTQVISFVHHKGGTGKTSSCISIAGYLAKKGYKVLAVDLDPQGNLTSGLGIDKSTIRKSMFDVMGKRMSIKEILIDTNLENIHVAPSGSSLIKNNSREFKTKRGAFVLGSALKSVKEYYDFILIDTPPSHGYLILNGAAASDKVVMVLDPGIFALEGVKSLQEAFDEYNKILKCSITIHSAILTKCRSSLLPFVARRDVKEIGEELKKIYKDKVFLIPYSDDIYYTHKKGIPISHYNPQSRVGKAYEKVVNKILE